MTADSIMRDRTRAFPPINPRDSRSPPFSFSFFFFFFSLSSKDSVARPPNTAPRTITAVLPLYVPPSSFFLPRDQKPGESAFIRMQRASDQVGELTEALESPFPFPSFPSSFFLLFFFFSREIAKITDLIPKLQLNRDDLLARHRMKEPRSTRLFSLFLFSFFFSVLPYGKTRWVIVTRTVFGRKSKEVLDTYRRFLLFSFPLLPPPSPFPLFPPVA